MRHEIDAANRPPLACTDAPLETATFGMGCFWSPDALFGSLAGVVRTRTGFAGGVTANPTYRDLGDHTETVELDYDPRRIGYAELLDIFWDNHRPENINGYKGRQYQSLALYRGERQREDIRQTLEARARRGKQAPETEVAPLVHFYMAEERHQKYNLKRFPDALARLSEAYPNPDDWTHATLAARLNGLAKGFTNRGRVLEELGRWEIGAPQREALIALVRRIRW